MKDNVRLWSTVVGSHAWRMNHEGSDMDTFTCYLNRTDDILSGEVRGGGAHFTHGSSEDEQRHELERWVDEMVRNNANYVTGVFSPLVRVDAFGLLGAFRCVCLRGRSKSIYASTRGIAESNLLDVESGKFAGEKAVKKLRMIERQLLFGVRWLDGDPIEFRPVTGDLCVSDVRRTMLLLDMAKDRSALPERCPNVVEFRSFQHDVRMWDLGAMSLKAVLEAYIHG